MTAAAVQLEQPEAWESFIEQHEEGEPSLLREDELEAVLRFIKRKGARAYEARRIHTQLLLAELVGELERGEHRR